MAVKRHHANQAGKEHGKTRMHMGLMMIAGHGRVTRLIRIRGRCVVVMVGIVVVTVMAEVRDMVLRMLQRIANTDYRGGSGIERKQDGNKKGEAAAHGCAL